MLPKVEKLTAADYDELLDCLNDCFGKDEANSFDKILPSMWRRTDEYMSKHLVVRDGARIAAVVGVYPLPVRFGKHDLLFATVGNVGTREPYRKSGYMKALMTEAMEEVKRLHVDVARLGGARQRYNRYGFEKAGQLTSFSLSKKNISAYYDGTLGHRETYTPRLIFKTITPDDTEALTFARNLQESSYMYSRRGDLQRFYEVMTAWRMVPTLAMEPDGTPVGFISANPEGTSIAEHAALTPALNYQMLLDWLSHIEAYAINFTTFPWQTELTANCAKLAESWSVSLPTHFKVINWLPVLQAALDARTAIAPAPRGHLVVRISGYGTLSFMDGSVTMTDAMPDLTLDRLAATRFFFGILPAPAIAALPPEAAGYAAALFPLPISWNNQDRV